jgi:hypothetical protein
MHAVIGTMDGESAAPQIGIAGSEISRRLGPRQIGVSKGDPERRVNNDLQAVPNCPVFNRPHRDQHVRSRDGKLTGQPRCDKSMSHAASELA